METPPPPERFWMARFAVHATRGLIRDAQMRRKTMALLLGLALAMLAVGLLAPGQWLDPHEHPARFLFFWFACGWLTVTAVLLAFLDMLILRAAARRERKALREQAGKQGASGE
jgi:formate-dependent nitrite reductase membrane component NrfD